MIRRNHVDPTLVVPFLHITNAPLTRSMIRNLIRNRGTTSDILKSIGGRSSQIRLHETYHYWQALRLPFVNAHATWSFWHMARAFREISSWTSSLQALIEVADGMRPRFQDIGVLSQPGYVSNEYGSINYTTASDGDAGMPSGMRLTPLGMLECAASLAEFQMTQAQNGQAVLTSPVALGRWRKRNPHVLDLYDFVADALGCRIVAMRCTLPLINASFHTSDPTRALAELLRKFRKYFHDGSSAIANFVRQPEPCRWNELFALLLRTLSYEAAADSHTEFGDGPFIRLTLESIAGAKINGNFPHPFIGAKSREWIRLTNEDPSLAWALDMPGWVPSATVTRLFRQFSPALVVYRVQGSDGCDELFVGGDLATMLQGAEFGQNESDVRGMISDCLTMYGVVRRMFDIHLDPNQRTCRHSDCPYAASNFCNAYPIIPDNFQECGFPARIERLLKEGVDASHE